MWQCAEVLFELTKPPVPFSPTSVMNDPATMLDRLTGRVSQLYSLPAVAMQVLELTDNPQVDTHALRECIENDPALTGKILRVVNSSLFGLSREVSDLNQALALLGTKPLKLLVLGFSLPAGLFAGVTEEILGWYWRHTLTKAVAGREISETLWNAPGDDAFIAGLLQDLGMLLLIQELGEPYVRFLDKARGLGKDLAALETESMGFDHTMLSAKLLADWGLPKALVEAVAWESAHRQSNAASSPDQTLPQILHLAELVARLLADGRSEVLGELLEVGRGYRDLSEAQLETLVGALEEKVGQLADVLSLQLPEGLDYRDVLVKAHSQLADVATEAAEEMFRGQQGLPPRSEEDSLLAELQSLAAAVAEVSGRTAESADPKESPPPEEKPAAAAPGRVTAAPGRVAAAPGRVAAAPGWAVAEQSRGSRVAGPATVEADPGLLGRLTVAVTACRQARCPLSLLLIQLDHADELVITRGLEGFRSLQQLLETACRNVDHRCAACTAYGEAGFALILPDCERRTAVQLGSQLIGEVRRLAPVSGAGGQQTVSISVGAATVALPPKNFPPEDLLTSADRCLYGSQASGGGVLKSIEIY